jgi:acyl-CoA synthetase (AMP-forming)/AMP-acid ligase II
MHICRETEREALCLALLKSLTESKGNAQYINHNHGVRHGPVLLYFDEHSSHVEWFWSVLAAGLTPAVSNPLARNQEDRNRYLKHIHATLEFSLVITSEVHRRNFEILEELGAKVICIEHSSDGTPVNGCATEPDPMPSTGDPVAFYMFTSGSTGAAKAVGLRHDMVLSSLSGKMIATETHESDVFLNWIGLYPHKSSVVQHSDCLD